MRLVREFVAVTAALCAMSAFSSGFSLYEASTISHAMGNALIGKAMDASANFNNPATLTDLTNLQFTVGFVTEHPRGRVEVSRNGRNLGEQTMDPGMFWLPHFQMAMPLPWDFTFGLSGSAEYGLGTQYNDHWPMDWNATDTTVEGFVLNPNLAWKWGDWSIGGGLRWLFFSFEQYKNPYADAAGYNSFNYHLKGDNEWKSMGWQIGTKYDILDNLSVGLVYKSAIDVTVEGDTDMSVRSALPGYATALSQVAAQRTGSADADLTLPQSLTAGINWDVTKKWHLGTAVSWTQWSELDTLVFNVKPESNPVSLGWHDTWRASVGSCWDFIEDWKWMVSYTYDMDCTSNDQTSVMLPPANRHILATGFAWNVWRGLELALSYSCVFMDGGDMHTSDSFENEYDLETCWGFCHAAGFSVTYRF